MGTPPRRGTPPARLPGHPDSRFLTPESRQMRNEILVPRSVSSCINRAGYAGRSATATVHLLFFFCDRVGVGHLACDRGGVKNLSLTNLDVMNGKMGEC